MRMFRRGTSSTCRDPRDGRQTREGERVTKNGGIGHERTVPGRQGIKARRDQGGKRLGHGERREVAGWPKYAVLKREPVVSEKHPRRLDREERNAVRSGEDRCHDLLREAGYQSRNEFRALSLAGGARGTHL